MIMTSSGVPVVERLTKEQVEEMRDAFIMFDKDDSGTISCKELGMLMRSLGQNPTEAELMQIVNESDVDGSGKMEFNEFVNLMADRILQTDVEREVQESYRVFDMENKGYIDVDELRFVMRNIDCGLTYSEIEEMLREADHDHDGRITFEEFATIARVEKHHVN